MGLSFHRLRREAEAKAVAEKKEAEVKAATPKKKPAPKKTES